MPGFSAKTVHFPPQPTGVPAPQTSLAALTVSTLGESAGFSCENGSLSPAAGRGTGSTDLSRRTHRFHPWGKCRTFPRKRFTFPRGRQGRWLHRPLWRHPPFPPPGKVPGFSAKTVHFPPWLAGALAPQTSLAAPAISTPRGKCREFPRKRFTFPRSRQGHRLHRPLSRHSPSLPPGKVPGFSAKTVHFPPRPTGVPAPQASLAAPAISTPRGKCREFPRKRFTFPRSLVGVPAPQASLAAPAIPSPGESAGFFGENGSLSPAA